MPPSVFIAVQCKQMLLVLKAYVQICQSICMAAVISAVAKADICHHVHVLIQSSLWHQLCVCAYTTSTESVFACARILTQTHAYELNGNCNPILTRGLN